MCVIKVLSESSGLRTVRSKQNKSSVSFYLEDFDGAVISIVTSQ